jgi:hypothetical protein
MVFDNNTLGGVHVQGPASGAASYTIENNTFAGGSGVTITAGASTTGTIRNNIFAGQTVAPIQIASADGGSVEYGYNLFYNCAGGDCAANWHTGNLGAASSEHDNLFDLDPMFASSETGDYQLSPISPAIDSGDPNIINEMVYDGDGDGQPRIDLGAFEYFDSTPPTVQSITRASASPIGADNVNFSVTFSEAVTGVDVSDFTLTTTGISGAAVSGIGGSGSTYTVTVNTGSGDGTIRLNVQYDGTIVDDTGNTLGDDNFNSGEIYTIKKTLPIVNTFTTSSSPTSLFVPITAFTASDPLGIGGYIITEASTVPDANDSGWSETAPTTYTVATEGNYTLYPWAKDVARLRFTSKRYCG